MSSNAQIYQTLINGQIAITSDLNPLAFAGFAHFTAIQVRNRKIKGLDLHLDRLHKASLELFGNAPAEEQIQSYIKTVVDRGPEDQSVTVTVFSPFGEFTSNSIDVDPSVLVRAGIPSDGPAGPLRLSVVNYERPLASIKHVGEVGKTYYLHQAIKQGFNDAAFVDNNGLLSEATIWNLVFWDGGTVVWPKANMLKGTMMSIIQRQLEQMGVSQRCEVITLEKLSEFSGAAVMNSWTPGIPVTAFSSTKIAETKEFMNLLHRAYKAEPAKSP
jgi:branched-subunit amino acid aminotransferase/4-amino-4-deoxychorismate lyase